MVSQLPTVLLTRASLMALNTFGSSIAARMAITASTPIISISVKPSVLRLPARFDLADVTFICFVPRVAFVLLFYFVVASGRYSATILPRLYHHLLARTIRSNTDFVVGTS